MRARLSFDNREVSDEAVYQAIRDALPGKTNDALRAKLRKVWRKRESNAQGAEALQGALAGIALDTWRAAAICGVANEVAEGRFHE